MRLVHRLNSITQQLQDVALVAAAQHGKLELRQQYADHYWEVTVFPDGRVTYGSYAEEARGPNGTVDQLTLGELASLAEVAQEKDKGLSPS